MPKVQGKKDVDNNPGGITSPGGNTDLYSQWLEAFECIGTPAIGRDKAARLLAILYVYGGGNECFTHHNKIKADLQHIQRIYHIDGGEVPDAELVPMIQQYVKECEEQVKMNHVSKGKFSEVVPWATDFLMEHYGVKLNQQ